MNRLHRASLVAAVIVVVFVMVASAFLAGPTSTNRPVPVRAAISWNPGVASRYHAPISAMGQQALVTPDFKPEAAQPRILAPSLADPPSNISVNAVRFINDTSYMPQSETTVALDPSNTNHVVAGVNDGRMFFCGGLPASDCPDGYTLSVTGFTVSADGGQTILKSDNLPGLMENVNNKTGVPFPEFLASWGDPSLAPGVNGEFYFATLAISLNSSANGIELAISNVNLFNPSIPCTTSLSTPEVNACWTAALVFGNMSDVAPTFEDKDRIAVDHDPTSPYYGDVYVTWDHFFANGTSASYVARCTPALTCTMLAGAGPAPLSGTNAFAAFTTPVVGSDGSVDVTWCNYGTFTSLGPITCYERSSAPNGGAFGTTREVLSFEGTGTDFPGYTGLLGFATEQFRTASIPVIAVDTSGGPMNNNLYFVIDVCTSYTYYAYYSPAEPGNCGASGVLFSMSSDGGATWSAGTLVSGAGVNVQPWVTVDPTNGNVVVVYYTTRYDPFDHRIDVVASVSADGGTAWSDVRVTSVSNEPDSDPSYYYYLGAFGGSWVVPQYGDYFEAVAYGGLITTVFTANYAVEVGTFQTDPWLAVSPERGPIQVAVTATPNPADPTVPVAFAATAMNAAGAATYSWDFGDGATGSGSNPTHAYASPGTYTATVTLTDSLGRTATDKVTVVVSTVLAATASVTPTETDVGLNASFSASPAGGTAPYTVTWSFGDGSKSTGASRTHSYASVGTYTATYWVNDSAGASISNALTVVVNALPTVSLTASKISTDVGMSVSFTATVGGGTAPTNALTWAWGDQSSSATGLSAAHTWTQAGAKTVTATVVDGAGGTGSKSATITVNALPVVSIAPSTYLALTGDAVAFTSTVTGGTTPLTYAWDFKDGGTATDPAPSHAFASAGTYAVALTVTDAAGASVLQTVTITVTAPTISTTSAILYAVIAFIVGAAIAALVLLLLGRRKKQAPAVAPPAPPPPPPTP